MRKDSRFPLLLTTLLALGSTCTLLPASVTPQTTADKARPGNTFGPSLRRPGERNDVQHGTPAHPKFVVEGRDQSEDIIRVDTSLVVIDVLVTDASGARYITGLTRDDFTVFEDDQLQEVAAFTLGDDAARLPRSIVLIFDRSDSQLAFLEASVEAAKKLVNRLAPTDEMAIVTDDVELAIGFTADKKKLKSVLDSLRKFTLEGYRTRSMQFSALLATLRELIDAEKKRPIIVFQTDGDEVGRLSGWQPVAGEQLTAYGYDMNDVYAEVGKSRAKIYTVVPSDKLIGFPEEEAERRARLMMEKQRGARAINRDMWYGYQRHPRKATGGPTVYKIPEGGLQEFREKLTKRYVDTFVQGQIAANRVAELTGGWTSFLEKPEKADDVYGRILADINRRYVIGYYPTNKVLDGKLRKVRIEVRGRPDYVVQGRRSYQAVLR